MPWDSLRVALRALPLSSKKTAAYAFLPTCGQQTAAEPGVYLTELACLLILNEASWAKQLLPSYDQEALAHAV